MKKSLLAVVVLSLLIQSGCQRQDEPQAGAQSQPKNALPLIVAHRGASHLAPENTLAAFKLAWELDADCIEGDFYFSSDDVIVCHHDKTTKETAGLDVPVSQQSFDELRQLDVGSWKAEKWAGERMPTLEEVLATVPDGKIVLIEIKTDERIVPTLAKIIESAELEAAQMVIIAFDEDVIAAAKTRLPHIKAFWLSGFDETDSGGWEPTIDEIIATAQHINADGVDLKANLDVIDESFVAALRAADLEWHAYTINEPDIARRLVELGVDSITTDRPGWLRERLGPED